eukprot:SAG22_NODE_9638_length_578_cov_0.832985_1_plen_117_part_01
MPVVAVDITSREPFEPDSSDGGPPMLRCERLSGELTFEVDPAHPANAGIVDIHLAPTVAGTAGTGSTEQQPKVRFTADFSLVYPQAVAGAPPPPAGCAGPAAPTAPPPPRPAPAPPP